MSLSISDPKDSSKIAIFKGRKIRKVIFQDEWWFVIEDIVLALIDSSDPKQYINRMKSRDPELQKGWVQFVHTLSIETIGGSQLMNCANTEGIFRIIQSIPSPKAEPFKRWLAKQGGAVAGSARKDLEQKSGKKVSTKRNFLSISPRKKLL